MLKRFLPVIVLLPALAAAQEFGPIQTRNMRSLSQQFLRFYPGEHLLDAGAQQFDFGYTNANEFRRIRSGGAVVLEEDAETSRALFRYQRGMKGGFTLGAEVPLVSRGGGFMDPIIDWYHTRVLNTLLERHDVPFGRSVIAGPGYSFGSASGLGDVTVTAAQRVGRNWIAEAGVKLPTGEANKLLGSGSADAGLSFYGDWAIARKLRLFAQVGGVVQGRARNLPGTRGFVDQESLGLLWQRNSRDGWVVTLQAEASALKSGISASDANHRIITVGYERKISPRQLLSFFFSEDRDFLWGAAGGNVGPDFTMGLRLATHF